MKHGPFLFLGLFFALSLSWLGMIVAPQFQLGNAQPTNVPPANILYPTPPPGLANQGREVYRANGCASCHTRVVRQDGTRLDLVLTNPGTNAPGVVDALIAVSRNLKEELSHSEAQNLVASAPKAVLTVPTGAAGEVAQKALSAAGAQVSVRVVPLGPEIDRGWGTRLSVASDYLYDLPLMLGTCRLGPDLTNVGLRKPDRVWQLVHLYDPKIEMQGSMMPRYPFLFEKHKRGSQPSPNALPIAGDEEIVPTAEAEALVGYLLSLRAEMPLFEAPGPPIVAAAATNLPAATGVGTNEVPGAATTNQSAPK